MAKITVTEVSDNERINFLPNYFGPFMPQALKMESRVYDLAGKCIEGYKGDYWVFKETSNGAGYMAPSYDGKRNITNVENYYEGQMSADAAGLAITAMVVNQFVHEKRLIKLCDLWENLLDVISSHEEMAAIRAFLD